MRRSWWQASLLLFAASRVVCTALIGLTIRFALPASRIGVHARLLDVLTAWDGQWYRLIALEGYPAHLPTTTAGITENAWAFLPVYPWLVRLLALGSAAAWPAVAVAVSVVSGAAATVLLAALVRPAVGDRGAVVTAALFAFSPVSFLLETTYAESLALALLFGALLLVDRRRYLVALPVVVLLAFTRPGIEAVALFVALRFAATLREPLRPRARDWAGAVLLITVALGGGWAWPAIATAVTHTPSAYVRTELSWRQFWLGSATLQPFEGWISSARFWFGPALGPIVLAVLVAGTAALLLSRAGRATGASARLWTLSWCGYLLAVFFPQSSVFRLLMPLAPFGSVLAGARTRTIVGILLLSTVAQGVWISSVYGGVARWWGVP